MTAILHLNLHREFFAQIAAGTKRTEHRSRTPYWRRRLDGRHYDAIQFRNAYATKARRCWWNFADYVATAKAATRIRPSALVAS